MAIEPNASGIDHILMGYAFVMLDLTELARRWFEKAKAIRPDMAYARWGLVMVSALQDDFDAASAEAEDFILLRPQSGEGYIMKAYVSLLSGDLEAARESAEKSLALAPPSPRDVLFDRAYVGHAMMLTGHADEGREVLEKAIAERMSWIEEGDDDPATRYGVACAAVAMGKKDEAYRWLEQAIDCGFVLARVAERDPLLAPLRDEQRFREMMAGLRAKVAKMRERVVESGWATPPAGILP